MNQKGKKKTFFLISAQTTYNARIEGNETGKTCISRLHLPFHFILISYDWQVTIFIPGFLRRESRRACWIAQLNANMSTIDKGYHQFQKPIVTTI